MWSVLAGILKWGLNPGNAWLFVMIPRVVSAIDRTRTEREQVTAERDAFDSFAERIAALDTETQSSTTNLPSQPATTPRAAGTMNQPTASETPEATDNATVATVLQAYHDTVMAVSHYESEYGEPIEQNLAAELSPEVAQLLKNNTVLTPQLQAALLTETRQASNQRNQFLTQVDTEYDALVAARRQLRDLRETTTKIEEQLYPRPLREIIQSHERLETKANECTTLLYDRQERLHAAEQLTSVTSLQNYLYQSFEWEYPVLNDGLDTLSRIRHAKRRAVRAIYNWGN